MKAKKNAQEQVNELIEHMAENLVKSSDHLRESVVGRAVVALLREKPSITRQDLREWIEHAITLTPSARGRMNPKLDVERVCLDAALRLLEEGRSPKEHPQE